MINHKLEIFLIIQAAMVAFAYSEAVLEGEEGWARDKKCWRFRTIKNYDYTSYHLVTYYILFPIIIIFLPIVVVGYTPQLFWLLFASYLIGTILEDFMWFVFNPCRPFSTWNHKETTWYPWIKIGKFASPLSYIVKLVLGVLIFIYFV